MRKLIAMAVLAFAFVAGAAAQPKAAGVRFGAMGIQASYEHYFGDPHFLEAEVGVNPIPSMMSVEGNVGFNWVFAQPSWTPRGAWAWYAGPGVVIGVDGLGVDNHFVAGITAQVGMEYTFWFPLQLSVDMRPAFGIRGREFWAGGIMGAIPSISARYFF